MRDLPNIEPEDPLGCVRGFCYGCVVQTIVVTLCAILVLLLYR
jgi:hypothetical protein